MRWGPVRKLPAEILGRLDLRRPERVLATARSLSDEWYVGTDLALHLPDPDGYRRVPWEEIERAEWQRDTESLALVEVSPWGEPERTTVVQMSEPGHLLELLRERVTKSILCTVYAPVRRRAGITVIGRKSPSGHGPVLWSYLVSNGLDPADPDVERVAEATLTQARRELAGLEP